MVTPENSNKVHRRLHLENIPHDCNAFVELGEKAIIETLKKSKSVSLIIKGKYPLTYSRKLNKIR